MTASHLATKLLVSAVTVSTLIAPVMFPASAPAQSAAPDVEVSGTLVAPWPMFGRTAQRTGLTSVVGPQTAVLEWTVVTGNTGSGASSPVVGANEIIYVADVTGLTALAPSGTPLWRYRSSIGPSAPAIGSDGTIYVGSSTGLVALEPDGTLAWRYPSGNTGGPVVAESGTVYAVGSGPALYAVRRDGTLQWRRRVRSIRGIPALGQTGTVYVTGVVRLCGREVCFPFGLLFAFDPATGRPRLVYVNRDGGEFTSPPVVGVDETIYMGTDLPPGALYALHATGGLKWRHQVGGGLLSPPALGADETVYAAAGDGFVYAIRPDGTEAWRYETEGAGGPGQGALGMTSSPVVAGDGTIYIGSQDSFVYALNPEGTLKWQYQTMAGPGARSVIQTSPAVGGDGTVYISGWIGNPQPNLFLLYAFGATPALVAP